MHPSQRIRGLKSSFLAGKRIALAVSGSIAAVESVRIAHELIRHGADVQPVMSGAAQEIITPLALEYATGHRPVTRLTGAGEHVALCGGGRGSADLLLVAPATANTIAKMALGIDDTPITTCASVALGAGVPVVVAPAMHEVMGSNPGVQERLRELVSRGVLLVAPRVEEEKAKIATPESIADAVIHRLAKGPLVAKKVLVVSGSTAEPLDPVRVLTNRSTGRMGIELATAAYRRGAEVELWNAWGSVPLPSFASVHRFETVHDLQRLVKQKSLSDFDAILVPAALSDFAPPATRQKISSDQEGIVAHLHRLPKILPEIRRRAPKAVLVGFKAETDAKLLLEKARKRLAESRAAFFVANTAAAFGADAAEIWIVPPTGKPRRIKGKKARLAGAILDEVARRLAGARA